MMKKKSAGQSMIEFTFCLVIFAFMMYASARFAFWLGPDLADRSSAYDKLRGDAVITTPSEEFNPQLFKGAVFGDSTE